MSHFHHIRHSGAADRPLLSCWPFLLYNALLDFQDTGLFRSLVTFPPTPLPRLIPRAQPQPNSSGLAQRALSASPLQPSFPLTSGSPVPTSYLAILCVGMIFSQHARALPYQLLIDGIRSDRPGSHPEQSLSVLYWLLSVSNISPAYAPLNFNMSQTELIASLPKSTLPTVPHTERGHLELDQDLWVLLAGSLKWIFFTYVFY